MMKIVRVALLLIVVISIVGAGVNNIWANLGSIDSTIKQTHSWPVDQITYARVSMAPDYLYTHPSVQSQSILNRLLYPESTHVSERHLYLDVGQVLRVKILNQSWAQIQPEYGTVKTSTYGVNSFVYLQLWFLEPLTDAIDVELSVFNTTKQQDKLIVVLDNKVNPTLLAFEGSQLVLKVPVVLGPTPYGDQRVFRKRISDDMPGIPGVPYSQCFAGGYCMHGAPWWNWAHITTGHYGSHGCINLPDNEWYLLNVNGNQLSVDEWLFAWTQSGLNLSIHDANQEEVQILSNQFGWYQPTVSTRLIVVNRIEELHSFATTNRLGIAVANSTINSWEPIINAYHSSRDNWLIPDINQASLEWRLIQYNMSPAASQGITNDDTWVMLYCSDQKDWQLPAAPGSSRTKGEVCNHFATQRPGSVCTPERIDVAYFGKRVYCVAERYFQLEASTWGELAQHENVHLTQFSTPLLLELFNQGITVDDPSIGYLDYHQLTLSAWLEFGAQLENIGSSLDNFYRFVLVRPTNNGIVLINNQATTVQVLEYLQKSCQTDAIASEVLTQLIFDSAYLEARAYDRLTQACGAAPHELVVDYQRN